MPLFADEAVARLHKLSLGLRRALDNAALIAAAAAGKALVDDDCAWCAPAYRLPAFAQHSPTGEKN